MEIKRFLGLADLEYNNRKNRISQRAYYYGYRELYNSSFYRGVEAAAMTAEMQSPFYHTMLNEAWTQEEVYWIDCGVVNENGRYKADIGYELNAEKEIYGGYETEGTVGYTNIGQIDNGYYSTYRYGADISYKFFNIGEDNTYILAFDMMEAYYTTERQREFDIKVETDKNFFVMEDLDSMAIAHGEMLPVRILIFLLKCEWVKISLKKNEKCNDVPYINGIGILKRRKAEINE